MASILKFWLAGTLLSSLAMAQTSPTVGSTNAPSLALIVEQMESAQLQARTTVPYQVTREYRLFGKNSDPSSEVLAEVDYLPPSHKTYLIQKRTGSSRGEEVVRRILQHEAQMGTSGKSWSGAMIDRNNYAFTYLGEAVVGGNRCYVMGLNPKRNESELVRGSAWVDQRSFLIRHIEGVIAKNPSWMLKKVEVKIDFNDVGGAWLQTGMEAKADVHFIGTQTLESHTVEAHVGEVVARNTPGAARSANRRSNRRGVPAAAIVPLERRP